MSPQNIYKGGDYYGDEAKSREVFIEGVRVNPTTRPVNKKRNPFQIYGNRGDVEITTVQKKKFMEMKKLHEMENDYLIRRISKLEEKLHDMKNQPGEDKRIRRVKEI